jgi:hypothetical protein
MAGLRFHCLSNDPVVSEKVDRLCGEVEKGRCFAGGPIAGLSEFTSDLRPDDEFAEVKRKFREHVSSGQELKRHRDAARIRSTLDEIYSALTADNPPRRVSSERRADGLRVEWSVPGPSRGSFWERLREAHASDAWEDRKWLRNETSIVALALAKSCEQLWLLLDSPKRLRALGDLLARRAEGGGDGSRFAFKDAWTLTEVVAVEVLRFPERTVRRLTRQSRSSRLPHP